ncbi:MAG: alkaline phosphatase family protein [Candidatus Acidiferrales bacterium]
MSFKHVASNALHSLRVGLAALALFQFTIGASLAGAAPPQRPNNNDDDTRTPIKHVIVIIGENRSFDHVFATYQPKNGETVRNLLSEGIVNADGTPGHNFYNVEQSAAVDQAADAFLLSPPKAFFPGQVLPAPLVGGAFDSYIPGDSLALAKASEQGLPTSYYQDLVSGGTGLTSKTPDTRITNVNSLPAGPFQLTNGSAFSYNSYAASPVHRFYQMWQQLDCSVDHATWDNPSGCDARLFPWVEVTVGAGSSTQLNGLPQPVNFNTEYTSGDVTTGEGSTAMGFYNVQKGDVPYFKSLADTYAMSDNFHQSVDGGTGANHIMFGHGDMIWFSDGNGRPTVPPHGVSTGGITPAGTPSVLDEVENPNAMPGTNNWWTEDGYGAGSPGPTPYGGGSYSDCADSTQPGVSTIVKYLQSLPRPINPNCEPGHYYLLNNYNPGYFGNGKDAFTDSSPYNTVFTVPPSSTRSIGDELIAANISWKYYGDQWNNYVPDPYQINYGAVGAENELGTATIQNADEYCTICNPFAYDTSIMANAAVRTAHLDDITGPGGLYSDITGGTLPAVSIVKPSAFVDGHPSSSKLDLFEGFTQKIVTAIQNSPYWKDTAIFITFDEGGGYYDSGYVQPLDFFGDGTRIPLIVVSPYSRGGRITHNYSDHVSILKFIERNWNLPPITKRSRDNFPNPVAEWNNPYVPINGPAISDLFELFDFGHDGADH